MSIDSRASTSRALRALIVGLLLLSGALASACFGAKAQVIASQPLEMPEPPPRVVEVSQPEAPPPVGLPEEPARTAPSTVIATQPRPADPPRQAEPPRTDPAAEAVKAPEEVAKPPATTLQTTPTQQEGELERKIRVLLLQASSALNRINYQALNTDGRTQYETVKRFMTQAEEAMKAKNLVFASNLADKASALASQLSAR
jgi:hypothetical protein